MSGRDVYLRDVLVIPEDVHAGEFKVSLLEGFDEAAARIDEYVVTPQLDGALRAALNLVKASVLGGKDEAAYLHGSYGSGKSHFMTVLHAILEGSPATLRRDEKDPLGRIVRDHDHWMRDRRFMMVPFHLVGATDLDSAILGGYVHEMRRRGLPTPPVYRSDQMLEDARRQRRRLGDDTRFAEWLGAPAPAAQQPDDDLPVLGQEETAARSGWTTEILDRAFAAEKGDPLREALETALLDGMFASYAEGMRGSSNAFLPLENGLAVIARHARSHGYDALILFIDELILWLQAHLADQKMVNVEVGKLVKLIESGEAGRDVPIVSFVSRQRNLSQLVGEDVVGADVKNLEQQVEYLNGRFTVINLEDRNLPEIIKQRVLNVRPGQEKVLAEAFRTVETAGPQAKDALLDAHGATGAGWEEFRAVYPLSPALLNVMVALAGALQRQRSGLKLISTLLSRRRDDMRIGQLVPLGDLWDVLVDGTGETFTDELRQEAEAAKRFYRKARALLLEKYQTENEAFRADDRIVKTLLLSALAPDVPALSQLTGARLAALNLGSIRSRTLTQGEMVGNRLRELIASGLGEIRADGDRDAVFSLHLSDLDVEPMLERVGEQDNLGARRIWVKDFLWKELGVKETGNAFVSEREVIWRGSRRIAEFVFENVRDDGALPDLHFRPSVPGRIRFVLDYPFDVPGWHPTDDAARVDLMRRDGFEADTLVWMPDHLSTRDAASFGRLLKIRYLLGRDRLDDYAGHLTSDQRLRVRNQLQAQAENLESQLTAVFKQLYGISGRKDDDNTGAQVPDGIHVMSLRPDYPSPRLQGGAGFEFNMLDLAGKMLSRIYPKHPDLDLTRTGRAVTLGELRTTLTWITKAMEDRSGRTVVDKDKLGLLRRIVHPLELGEVHDGPLTVSLDWARRIDHLAHQHRKTGDYAAEEIREWIAEYGWTGLDKPVANLVIAAYALMSDRVWLYNGSPAPPPELERIGPGWALRDQPKPTDDEYGLARVRAGALFGVHAAETLSVRNVGRLAEQVRARAGELDEAVNGVRRALERHAGDLGITDPATPRRRSARHAADLVARLVAAERDDTLLVRELAHTKYDVTDQVLGSALVRAPEVLDALNNQVDWGLLETVRQYLGRDDAIGRQAAELIEDITEAAAADERERALVPVLRSIRERAIGLIQQVGRLSVVQPPPPGGDTGSGGEGAGGRPGPGAGGAPTVPTPPPGPAPGPGPGPARTAPGRARRLEPADLDGTLPGVVADIQQEIRAFIASHPGTAIEISWAPVQDGAPEPPQ